MGDRTTTAEVDDFRHAIYAIRERFPDLRIGQIIGNALPARFGNDCYNIENDELIECLWEFARRDFTDA